MVKEIEIMVAAKIDNFQHENIQFDEDVKQKCQCWMMMVNKF